MKAKRWKVNDKTWKVNDKTRKVKDENRTHFSYLMKPIKF